LAKEASDGFGATWDVIPSALHVAAAMLLHLKKGN